MEEVNISTLGVASGSCFTDNSRGTFKDLFAEKLSLRVAEESSIGAATVGWAVVMGCQNVSQSVLWL